MSAPQSLAAQLATERRRLSDLVRAGEDTSHCRATISQIEEAIARETATGEPEYVRRAREQEAEFMRQVDEIARDRVQAIRAAVEPLSNPLAGEAAVDGTVQREHHDAVAAFLKVQEALRTASSRLDITSTEVQSLAQRQQALEHSREAMKLRRGRGDIRPEDRSELELIALDLEALGPLTTAATSANRKAAAARDKEHQDLAETSARLDGVEALIASLMLVTGVRASTTFASAAGKALAGQLDRLDQQSAATILNEMVALANSADEEMLVLIERISVVQAKAGRPGSVPAWGPSQKLAQKLRDLAVQRAGYRASSMADAAIASRHHRAALRAEMLKAAAAEIGRVGPDRFRAAVVRRYGGRGVARATLYRWLDAAEKSGTLGQRVSAAFRHRMQPTSVDPSDPTGEIAAANAMLEKLPQISHFGDVTGQQPIAFADGLRECLIAARDVMRHARDAAGRVRNPKMLVAGSETLRRTMETAARILERVHEIQRVEEFHKVIIEEIRKESPDAALRILQRVDVISQDWGAV